MQKFEIYTDGSSLGNPGRGGWAFLILKDLELIAKNSGGEGYTTNNRMETLAVIEGLKYFAVNIFNDLEGQVLLTIYSDSQLVIRTMTENWKRKKNQDLWIELDKILKILIKNGLTINWQWVKGHATNKYNNIVDEMAQRAAAKEKGLSALPKAFRTGLSRKQQSLL